MSQQMRVLQHQQLPPEAEQLAGTYQLGTPQAEYKVGSTKQIILWIILSAILGIVTLVSPGDVMILMLIILLPCLGMILYYAFRPLIYRSWHVYVCTDGFVFTRGNKIEAFRWDQIEAMWQAVTRRYINGIYTGTVHRYTVRGRDARQVIFSDRFTNVEELGNTISRAITNYQLPQVIATYNAGNTLTFGPLSISTQGVSNGKELLPWSQVKEMGVNRGVVTVRKEGKWLNWSSARVAQIPNVFVFMALANYILKGQK